jgi:hypothetical protein
MVKLFAKMEKYCVDSIKLVPNKKLGPYSQHFIFFVTYKSAQYARMFHNIRLQSLSNVKHSN